MIILDRVSVNVVRTISHWQKAFFYEPESYECLTATGDIMTFILGIDLGTQSVKAGLVDLDTMVLVEVAARNYDSEPLQDAAILYAATCGAIKELTVKHGNDIAGVGFSGQMHGTVMLDADGDAIAPVINWQDNRCNLPHATFGGKTAIEKMTALITPDQFSTLGIDRMASGFMSATLFHTRHCDPDLFMRIDRVLFPGDYIRFMLAGKTGYFTDVTNGFGSGVMDTAKSVWHYDVIDNLGLDNSLFPEIRDTKEICGKISPEAAALTGLRAGTPLTTGGGDNQMAMIGSGVFDTDGTVLLNIGTGSQVSMVVSDYSKKPGIDTRSFINGKFALSGPTLAGGMCYTWLRNQIAADIAAVTGATPDRASMFAALDRLAMAVPAGCEGLAFEPYLRGTRREPSRHAAFTGISMDNYSLGHRARAVMEGVVAELAGFYRQFGYTTAKRIVGAGNGLVNSEIWCRIAADAFGMPVSVMDSESATYGAAITAAEGLGLATIAGARFEYIRTVTN